MLEELNGDFLQWLRGFYYVARTGSVRKAATLMNRNPSTISYQIRCLEEELNVVLFDRVKRTLRITEDGKKLFGWTLSTFETLRSMRSSIGNINGQLQGELQMAGTLPIITLATPAISRFVQAHPKVKLRIERGLSPDIRRCVSDLEADFGLGPITWQPDNPSMEVLFKARPLLVFAKKNSWRIPPVPTMDDLKRLPFVSFRAPRSIDDFDMLGFRPEQCDFINQNSVISVNNYHIIMRFIWHGLGVSIMDELCYHATRFGAEWDKLGCIPLDHILPNRIYGIITRKHKRLSPQAEELIRVLRAHFINLPSVYESGTWFNIRQTDDSLLSENGGADS